MIWVPILQMKKKKNGGRKVKKLLRDEQGFKPESGWLLSSAHRLVIHGTPDAHLRLSPRAESDGELPAGHQDAQM